MAPIQRTISYVTSTVWAVWQIGRTYLKAEAGTQTALKKPELALDRTITASELLTIQIRAKAINRISKLWPNRIQCAQRSYALWEWLEARGFNPTMEVGWSGRKAHAWVRIGSTVLNDSQLISENWVSLRKDSDTKSALDKQQRLSEQQSHWMIAIAAIKYQLGVKATSPLEPSTINNWENLFSSIDAWKVGSAVENFLQSGGTAVPKNIVEMLKKRTAFRRARYTATLLELVQLTEEFRNANVNYIYIKGFSVSARIGFDPTTRDMVDLDFLVTDESLKAAHEVLVRSQYKPEHDVDSIGFPRLSHVVHHEMIYSSPKAILPVELHWRLNEIKFLKNRNLGFFTNRTQQLSIAGNQITSLDPIAATILAAMHGARNHWYQLRWIADFAGLIKALSSDEGTEFVDACRHTGCLRLVAASLQLTRDLLSIELPTFADNLLVSNDPKRDELVSIWKELCVPGPNGIIRDAAKKKRAHSLAYPNFRARVRQRVSEIVSPDFNLIAEYPKVHSKLNVVVAKFRRRYF